MPTKVEFAQKIKQKYPEYADTDDIELADRIIAKYPEYRESITDLGGQLKQSTRENLARQEDARQAIIQREQRPASQKVLQAAGAIPGAVIDIGGKLLSGIPQIPTVLSQPSTILPTLAESGRRTGMDIVQLGNMLIPKTRQDIQALAMGPAAQIVNALSNLAPRTPTEQEITAELESAPLLGSPQELAMERESIAFEGANPALAESLTQATELISPIKGVQSLKSAGKGLAAIPSKIRSAIKPSKAAVGKRIEKAAEEEFGEIFHRNPNADKVAGTAIEGFAAEVEGAFKEAGEKISELRSRSGTVLNAGDQIADKIEAKAAALERAGNKEIADELRAIGAEKRGAMTDINSLQDAVTLANRKSNILRPKTDAQGFADEIISKEGGSLINEELATVGGAEGAGIRKKWSNLKVINDNLQERVNKIINNAPADSPPAFVSAISSAQGAAGLFAVLNGYASAIPGLVAEGFKKWAQKEAKDLKNSDKIIQGLYKDARKTPPPIIQRPPALPPPIPQISPEAPFLGPDVLSEQIARQFSGSNPISAPLSQIPLEEALARQFVPQRGIQGFNPIGGTQGITNPALQEALNAAIAQSLSTGRGVPRIFLPTAP